MAHHVVMIALVTWSFAINYLQGGVLMILLQDASDVPVANFLKLEAPRVVHLRTSASTTLRLLFPS
ncbi:hypothetical protein H257_04678 [Aphanomyces astaci]|uniref:TLC domain-containing protein n=1 Tax=Aphanomyces astaci TaxID=112090 RepID=W4GT36_APHAT|nr:hypothetical protein H257_04678 [Aphanomyces astaci]ETV82905.1 hypothetical protein H257_04678 [Aphanomyces astaci]|eukprot:XP_009827576.1 hypothetical protein H257_04678 [Aphanomyces astaci]